MSIFRHEQQDGSDISSITGLGVRRNIYQAVRCVKKGVSAKRRSAKAKLFDLTTPIRNQVVLSLRESVKSQLTDDPAMWPWFRRWARITVDNFWVDIKKEIDRAAADTRHELLRGKHAWRRHESIGEQGETPWTWSPCGMRAFLLHHVLPYDKSIFGCLYDPVYLLLLLVSFLPDGRVLFYTLLLMLICLPGPADEYQLVQIILQVKAAQFVSSGVFLAFFGGMQYYMCVEEYKHTCDVAGPGSRNSTTLGLVDIFGSCLLIWVSFLVLPISGRSEGLRDDVDSSEDEDTGFGLSTKCCGLEVHQGRGGRLNRMLYYDLFCFLLSTCTLVVLEAWKYHKSDVPSILQHCETWQFRATLFWSRVLYSFLAFPFFVINLPVLNSIFTHTEPTGYNKNGQAVPYNLPPVDELQSEGENCKEGVLSSSLRQAGVNDRGNPVKVGRDGKTFYCGKPSVAAGWTGNCGPNDGPQCPSCQNY